MDKKVIEFLIKAKRKTYAGKGSETVSSREKSHDLVYRENNFMYYDTYLGGEKFAGEEAFLLKVTFTDGKTLYDWFFLKGDLVYRVAIEGTEETINSLRPILQNTWSLDPKFPRQY